MQYVFFEKGIRSVQWGLGQSSRRWGIFENYCVKSKLKLQKKIGGAGCTSCSPNSFVGARFPRPAFMCPRAKYGLYTYVRCVELFQTV